MGTNTQADRINEEKLSELVETSFEEIADELGITQQSLSSRLRRGHRRLIGATLGSSM